MTTERIPRAVPRQSYRRATTPTRSTAADWKPVEDAVWNCEFEADQLRALVEIGDICCTRLILQSLLEETTKALRLLEAPRLTCSCREEAAREGDAAGAIPCRQAH